MRVFGALVSLAVWSLVVACGGSTVNESAGSGGAGGSKTTGGAPGGGGSPSGGGTTGSGGTSGGCTANVDCAGCTDCVSFCACVGGGQSCVDACQASGGSGGGTCVSVDCGPTGAKCCEVGLGCGTAGPGTSLSCTCTGALMWDCTPTGSGGSGGSGGSCTGQGDCAPGTTCCAGHCVNIANDPFNCGACGNVCAAKPPFCSGICTSPPCNAPGPPPPGGYCCGQSYCGPGQLCCDVQGPGPSGGPSCFTPTPAQPTCPIGCPLCQ